MASLVEAPDVTAELRPLTLDRSETSSPVESMLADAETNSPFDALTEELWYLIPTSPGSPSSAAEYLTPSRSPVDTDVGSNTDSTDEQAASLIYELLEYQGMLYPDGAELTESQTSSAQQSEHILYDCMWGSCDAKTSAAENITAPVSNHPSSPSSSHVSAAKPAEEADSTLKEECVEPAAVFPGLKTELPCITGIRPLTQPLKPGLSTSESGKKKLVLNFTGAVYDGVSLSPPLPSAEEEIDVVTVERFEHREDGQRKTSHSAPASRNSSPISSPARRKRHPKRLARISSQSSQNSNDSDDEARRASHNVLERKRRNDLKNSFDMLRVRIPELEENHRAPKVIILRKACEYIKSIQQKDLKLKDELHREQARQKKLLERLAYMRNLQSA